jgi:hypothetical protein
MTISRTFRIATAACAVSLAITLAILVLSGSYAVPAIALTALAGLAPLLVFLVATATGGPTWDEEVDAVRLIEEITAPDTDHSTPGSLTERPRDGARGERDPTTAEPVGWDILAWPGGSVRDLELGPSK